MNHDLNPPEPEGASDKEIRHLETLYEIASTSLHRQLDNFDLMEEKVWRHAALLGVVLGAFAIGLPTALKTITETTGIGSCLFAASYFGSLGISAIGLFCFVMAMKYEVMGLDPMTESFVDDQVEKSYSRSLVSLTKGAVKYYFENKDGPVKYKGFWAQAGWWALLVVLGSVSVSLGAYIYLMI